MSFLRNLLQKSRNLTSIRTYSTSELQPIEYPGFTYYPRHKNFKDPPIKPSKLFLVRRLSNRIITKAEKECLKALNLDGKVKDNGHIAVVQNIPETNALLWKVKHVVDIKPIFWKGELPKDGYNTILRMTGELVIIPKLNMTEEAISLSEKYSEGKMGRKYIKEYLLKKWQTDF